MTWLSPLVEAAGLLLQQEQKRREATVDINHRGTGSTIPHVAEIADQTLPCIQGRKLDTVRLHFYFLL